MDWMDGIGLDWMERIGSDWDGWRGGGGEVERRWRWTGDLGWIRVGCEMWDVGPAPDIGLGAAGWGLRAAGSGVRPGA